MTRAGARHDPLPVLALLPALVLAMALASCSAPPDPSQAEVDALGDPTPGSGSIHIVYEESAEYDFLARSLAGSGVFEGIAEAVTSVVALPSDIDTVFTTCGVANAFYLDGRVTMCYEFFDLFTSIFLQTSDDPQVVLESVLGTGAWVYLHELGHALVDQLEIPITGREEDSVDTLATLILLLGDSEGAVLSAADNFYFMARAAEGEENLPYWDQHSLDAQRQYDIACLVYGSDPENWAHLVGPALLPIERAEACPAEFAQKSLGWDRLLAPHYRR